jgi:MFS family permease
MDDVKDVPAPPTAAEATPAARRSAMFIAFLVVAIDLLGFGIVLPLLPRYIEEFLRGESPALVGVMIGVELSAFSAMQFFFAPAWGRLSDRIGRRPILLLGLAGSVLSYTLFGVACGLEGWTAVWLILASRIGAGVAGATISTAAAVIADCTRPEERARGMALIGAAFGIGFAIGPLLGFASLGSWSTTRGVPGFLAAGLSLAALLLAYRLLPETRRPGAPAAPHRLRLNFHRLYSTLRTPTVGLLVLAFFLATFGFANFEGTLALLTRSAFDFSDRDNFLIFAFIGLVLMVAQGLVYRRLAKFVREEAFIFVGVALMFLGLANLAGIAWQSAESQPPWLLWWFLAALTCAVFGFAFLNPSIQSLISRRSDPARQGEVLGVNQSFSALARILGPLMGPILFKLTERHVLPYVVAAGLLGAVLTLVPRIRAGAAPV